MSLSTDDSKDFATAFIKLYNNANRIILYFFTLSVIGGLAGAGCKLLVKKQKWDRKYKFFRFQNEWHYLFTAEIFDFPRIIGTTKDTEVDFTYVDALVESDGGPILYMGLLQDYILSKEGGIDRIYLSDTTRRLLRDDDPQKLSIIKCQENSL